MEKRQVVVENFCWYVCASMCCGGGGHTNVCVCELWRGLGVSWTLQERRQQQQAGEERETTDM